MVRSIAVRYPYWLTEHIAPISIICAFCHSSIHSSFLRLHNTPTALPVSVQIPVATARDRFKAVHSTDRTTLSRFVQRLSVTATPCPRKNMYVTPNAERRKGRGEGERDDGEWGRGR